MDKVRSAGRMQRWSGRPGPDDGGEDREKPQVCFGGGVGRMWGNGLGHDDGLSRMSAGFPAWATQV